MTFEKFPVFLFESVLQSIISSLVTSLKCYGMDTILPDNTAGVTKKAEKDTILLITKTTISFFFFFFKL